MRRALDARRRAERVVVHVPAQHNNNNAQNDTEGNSLDFVRFDHRDAIAATKHTKSRFIHQIEVNKEEWCGVGGRKMFTCGV